MSQGGSAPMGGTGQMQPPAQSGMMGGMGGPLSGMGQAQQDVMGGPANALSKLPPHVQNLLQHTQSPMPQQGAAGGKGGMPGAQQNPMQQMGGGVFGMRRAIADLSNRTGSAPMQQNPMQQNPMQQQGLASLLKPQQSSTNSLQ